MLHERVAQLGTRSRPKVRGGSFHSRTRNPSFERRSGTRMLLYKDVQLGYVPESPARQVYNQAWAMGGGVECQA